MNWLDIVITVILVIAAFWGLRRGLIEMVLSVVGVVLGIFLAGHYYENVGSLLKFVENSDAANILGFAIILIATMLVFYILAKLITKLADIALVGWINRVGGALIGVVIATLVVAALLAVITKIFEWNTVGDSFLASFFLEHFPRVLNLLPSSFDSIKEWFNK